MANDTVRLAMEQAAQAFGGPRDGLFNAAGFGHAMYRIANLKGGMDGLLVRAVLCGRNDVEPLTGGHYRLRDANTGRTT